MAVIIGNTTITSGSVQYGGGFLPDIIIAPCDLQREPTQYRRKSHKRGRCGCLEGLEGFIFLYKSLKSSRLGVNFIMLCKVASPAISSGQLTGKINLVLYYL